MAMIDVDFVEMNERDLEYRVSSEATMPNFFDREFEVISDEKAKKLYFPDEVGKTNVYLIIGKQKGDEGKGMTTEIAHRADPAVGWTLAPNSTHNAGKGVHTQDEFGNDVKVSLHLCPATLPNPDVKNYIGQNVQANLFSLETEILGMFEKTGRNKLGKNYHLMIDSYANLVVPVNRLEDVVCKPNAMGSTCVGATASRRNASGKTAPTIEHVLYDPEMFIQKVNRQIQEFEDFVRHDEEFLEMNIASLQRLGRAMQNDECLSKSRRLKVIASKLSDAEKEFCIAENPAQFLLDQYKAICEKGLFEIGDCKTEINKLVAQGIPGDIEGVQSTLLSGGVKYSVNRTAANTHGEGTKGDANLNSEAISYRKILAMKFGNTSVGGNDYTMSGFIKQDSLTALEARNETGEMISFEKTDTLLDFISEEQRDVAFDEVTAAFYHAIENGYSLRNSKARISGIDMDMTLAQARALLTASKWGEKGETSKRARVCRMDDLVEMGVADNYEGTSLEVRNAVDRAMDLPKIGIITAYEVIGKYGGYSKGDIITPGMQLRQEHLTVKGCIPIIDFMESWPSMSADGGPLAVGSRLHPNLCKYLSRTSGENTPIAIGAGPKLRDKHFIREI
jgi:adenylosuccinate synthase